MGGIGSGDHAESARGVMEMVQGATGMNENQVSLIICQEDLGLT